MFNKFIKHYFPKKEEPNTFNLSICCIIKNENEYLEEWIKYHLEIGVEHFYLYDNDSKVPVKSTLQKLQLAGFTTVIRISGRARQIKAYKDCLRRFGNYSNWIAFIDTDEFILPKEPKGDLPKFLKNYEQYGGLGINWLIFGSNGHTKRTFKPQLESFTMRSEEDFVTNKHIKTIVQPKYVTGVIGSHSFSFEEGKFCVNENFDPITGAFSDNSVNQIQLNHYYCRSMEEYEDKIKRGLGDTRRKRTMDEFHTHNAGSNKLEDTTILEIRNGGKDGTAF